MSRADALTVAGVLLLASVLLWALITWWPRPPVEPTAPPATQTPRVIVVTATPRAVEAGPPTTRLPTPTMTPIPRDVLPMTPAATVTVTRVPPSETPRPERSPVMRG